MKALLLRGVHDLRETRDPLVAAEVPVPEPVPGEVLVKVSVCGVCHTELDEIEGRTPPPRYPVVLGHQIVGRVERAGAGARSFAGGERVGIAWIHSACGACRFCRSGQENLCGEFRATGRDAPGGYAEYTTVPEAYAHRLPDVFADEEAAPLLCAGAVGYRSLRLAGMKDGEALGLVGFGASGHLVLQMARHLYPRSGIYVFARSPGERAFAMELGARWAGDVTDDPPEPMARAIDTTPVWAPVVGALRVLDKGGRLVINAIRKEEADKEALLSLRYPDHLWLEKEIKTVANVTGSDVREFLDLAAAIPIRPEVELYAFGEANRALVDLKERRIRGAKVLVIGS